MSVIFNSLIYFIVPERLSAASTTDSPAEVGAGDVMSYLSLAAPVWAGRS